MPALFDRSNALRIILLVLFCEKIVDRPDEFVGVGAVDCAGFLDRLAARDGASEAVHPDGKEELRNVGVDVEQIADDGILRYCHDLIFLLFLSE